MKQLHGSRTRGPALLTPVSGIIIAITVIYFLIKLAGSSSYTDVAQSSETVIRTHIQPVEQLTLGDGVPVGERKGDQIFSKICIQYHGADRSVLNALKIENNDEWAPRIAQGFGTLFQHILNGFNAMPARGDATDLAGQELKRAITYMVNKGGGTFPDPDAAAPADAAVSGEAVSAPATEGVAPAEAPEADTAKADNKGTAAPAAGGADSKKVYKANCQACHGGAVPGVPHVDKKEDWAPRIEQGKDALRKHTLEGFNVMPAKDGNGSLGDDEMKATVDYMANQPGAKF